MLTTSPDVRVSLFIFMSEDYFSEGTHGKNIFCLSACDNGLSLLLVFESLFCWVENIWLIFFPLRNHVTVNKSYNLILLHL